MGRIMSTDCRKMYKSLQGTTINIQIHVYVIATVVINEKVVIRFIFCIFDKINLLTLLLCCLLMRLTALIQ